MIFLCSSSSGSRRSIRPSPPSTAARRLLKSWAMPPVSLPIASILRASSSCFSRSLRSVTSSRVPAYCAASPSSAAEQHRLVEEMLVLAVGALPAIFDRHRAGALAVADRAQRALAVLGMEPVGPERRLGLDRVEGEAGDRGEIAADELRHARGGAVRLDVEDDRKRGDDRRLALLGEAKLLLDPAGARHWRADWRRAASAPAPPCAGSPGSSGTGRRTPRPWSAARPARPA